MEKEVFKPVEGFKDYEVSNLGRVRSNKRSTPIIMKESYLPDGRAFVGFRHDGKLTMHNVAVLVAGAFVPNPEGCRAVRYKDNDVTNNVADNLFWTNAKLLVSNAKGVCSICDRPEHLKGLCNNHYQLEGRARRAGTPGARHTKTLITYASAHQRVRRARGLVTEQKCNCGAQAQSWALMVDAKSYLVQDNGPYEGSLYSNNPDDYQPLCNSCHYAYDRSNRTKWRRLAQNARVVSSVVAPTERRLEIAQHLKGSGSINKTADHFNIDVSYVSRVFRAVEGVNWQQYKAGEAA